MQILENQKAIIKYDPDGRYEMDYFSGNDITDHHNDPACYSRTMRSHKKAWAALKAAWTPETTMYQACGILRDNGIKMHTYCGVD